MYRVMLVDDEPSILDSTSRMIDKNPSFKVVCRAYRVPEAKQLIGDCRPDVLFSDIKMPGGSGLELIKYVSENLPHCAMVVISGYDDFKYVRDSFVYGVEDYLLKPVSPATFLPFLDKLATKLENDGVVRSDSAIERDSAGADHALPPSERLVRAIEAYVDEHIAEDNSISEICTAFSISQPYLSRIFRQHKDCSYNEFLASVRIAKAKRLLFQRQDLLISTIAALTGFSNQFYFSRVFKNAVGVTPSEYRGKISP
jgi:YesN/AraC family two-component response regulator